MKLVSQQSNLTQAVDTSRRGQMTNVSSCGMCLANVTISMCLKGIKMWSLTSNGTALGLRLCQLRRIKPWDYSMQTQERGQKKYTGHSGCVNSVNMSRGTSPLAVSGSDDGKAMVWDFRQRSAVQTFEAPFAVTAVSFSEDDELVFTAGIDNIVRAWDRRRESVAFTLEGHEDTVTGMSLSPDGASLLTNSMDKTLISWDVRPFVTGTRFSKQFHGAQHNLEKTLLKCSWSPDGEMISCGSSDHVVHIWDVPTGEELYHLPGHAGSVNEVAFHPTEPIVASCGSDKQIYLGEL
mmetsp:Transcript_59432/g.112170  ORF Transcript_59432/g.112170 Transcript_59432/m.112170 type:complete len:293 (-) Transcript_59432:334-1212(-)